MIALDHADAREYLVNLGADHRGALKRLSCPLLDAAAQHLHRQDEQREAYGDQAERRQHVVRGGKPDDESYRHEYLERRQRHLGEDGGEDDLDLMGIAKDAGEHLSHVHAPEELHVLPLHMLEHLLPKIGHRVRARPAQTVVVEIHETQAHQRHERYDHAYDEHQRPAHAALVVLKPDAQPRRPFFYLWIPGRQLGISLDLLFDRVSGPVSGRRGRSLTLLLRGLLDHLGLPGSLDLLNPHVVRLDMLQRRLHDLEERHERAGRGHAADDADGQAQPVLLRVFPHPGVSLAYRIVAIEEFLAVLDLAPGLLHWTSCLLSIGHRQPPRTLNLRFRSQSTHQAPDRRI